MSEPVTRQRPVRRIRRRAVKPLVLAVVEGYTEVAYLRALADEYFEGRVAIEVVKPRGTSIASLIDSARQCEENIERRYAISAVVCDVDMNAAHGHGPQARRFIDEDVRRRTVITDPAIEAWFLAHFETTRPPSTAKECDQRLRQLYLRRYHKGKIPRELIDRTDVAIGQARRALPTAVGTGDFRWPTKGRTQFPQFLEELHTLIPAVRVSESSSRST